MRKLIAPVLTALLLLAVGVALFINIRDYHQAPVTSADSKAVPKPANAVEISIIYAPEAELYLQDAIRQFNDSYAQGIDPLTGQRLVPEKRPIYVTGRAASSGTVHQGIINAFVAPNNVNVERPTIFSPSVSHWLALVNYQTGRQVFDLKNSPATAIAPVVMAIWESRLQALQAKHNGQPVGWQELLAVLRTPEGWAAYGLPGRKDVYYGHTDPFISSTALSTLIAEFYASASYHAGQNQLQELTLGVVENPQVQQGVRDIEQMIKHYSARTTEFKEYIAQGPDYLDFVALEENDLIYINQGKTSYQPPEKLVALYPKEGTFLHTHPFAIPNADWSTPEQRTAAQQFTDYVLSVPVQQAVLAAGFRPANPAVPLGYPIVLELGVDPQQPAKNLTVPSPPVVAAIQSSWQLVKKQADIVLLLDTSSSMLGPKLEQARSAALTFLDTMPTQNRLALVTFDSQIRTLVPLSTVEQHQADLRAAISGLQAIGSTLLYDGLLHAIGSLQAEDAGHRIRAIIVLSDGQDTASRNTLRDVLTQLRSERYPLFIFPVAYGSDADINALNGLARASGTRVLAGDPKSVQQLFELLGSYF
jgi:Ca-activated chloride channel family protein